MKNLIYKCMLNAYIRLTKLYASALVGFPVLMNGKNDIDI